ncbi:MAG TPA: peptidylprolyl isomerase [Ohtaekwangia sp.]
MMRCAVLLLFFAVSFTTGFSQSKSKSPKPVTLFTVNKQMVTAEEFIYLYKKNHPNKQQDFTPEKIQEYLDLFINFKLKVEEAKFRGMDTTKTFAREYNQYKDELRKPYLPDAALTDSLVKLTYNRMKEEVKVSHLLIEVKADAPPADTLRAFNKIVSIRSEIIAGKDFSTAAVQYSEDKSVKINQGNLGYFTALQMVYPFENAAYNTPVGQVSAPVRTQFGYHLLLVSDRQPSRGQVEVSHIMIRTGEDKDNARAKDLIFDIYDQLQANVKWDDLCKQYSDDPGSKENGGRLRPFGVGEMASVPEFEKMAFALTKPGEVSDPFQTQYGWHIIRLERIIPLASYDEIASSLKSRVIRDERTQLSKLALQNKLRKQFEFTEVQAVRTKVFATADSSLIKGTWKTPSWPAAGKDVLFSLKTKPVTVQEFFTYVLKNQRVSRLSPEKYLDQLYNNFVDATIIALQEEKIMQENPEYKYLLKEYYEGILLFEIMEKEVWNKASEDSVGQHQYYNAHSSEYKAGERTKASLYSSGTSDFMAVLQPLLLEGNERKILEASMAHKVKYESGYFKREDKAIFGKIPWSVGVHPVENNGMYYLAWLKDMLPPGTMSFEEARPAVISDYQTYLEKSWIAELKKKYPVKINDKGKAYIQQQLKP